MSNTILEVKHLNIEVPVIEPKSGLPSGEKIRILEDAAFSLQKGSFTLLCGPTGCGKSSLLDRISRGQDPEIFLEEGVQVAVVRQNPGDQIVTDKVWHELAFALENRGCPPQTIRRKVAEISLFFHIENWYDRYTKELSGGEKQILNLAAAMVSGPDLLLLDEPTAQLDPASEENFMNLLERLHREMGITILMAEHTLERMLGMADFLIVIKKGRIIAFGAVEDCLLHGGMKEGEIGLPVWLPLYLKSEKKRPVPLTFMEAKEWLEGLEDKEILRRESALPKKSPMAAKQEKKPQIAMEAKDVWFEYPEHSGPVLRGMDICLLSGEVLGIVGGNGSGKTTLLKLIAGIAKPDEGKIKVKISEVAFLPQDVEMLFLKDSVAEVLGGGKDAMKAWIGGEKEGEALADRHPYDLSGGEKQLLALSLLLRSSADKKILLLDEPTRGLDLQWKRRLANLIASLQSEGKTILLVTHDLEFAEAVTDRIALLFHGEIVECEDTEEFIKRGYFYTTARERLLK